MPRIESGNLAAAREIVGGERTMAPADLLSLGRALEDENHIGYARRVYGVAIQLPAHELADVLRIRLAFATYKDPDLPVDDRLRAAEALAADLLSRADILPVSQRQELFGILGGISRERWMVYGQKEHLEKAAVWYRRGYELGIAPDFGHSALNAAFVLDLLADAEGAADRAAEAVRIRNEIVASLEPILGESPALAGKWWIECTLGEALLGLRRFDEARRHIEKAAAHRPENWRLEAAARQLAYLVRLEAKADGLPLERWSEAPGFPVLAALLGGSAQAAMSFFLGKVGLALSGGGFRASLYHIGVLARLAELDMLRHVEVISSVSGGSILAAYYYLELRNLLQTKTEDQIAREDYIALVKRVETGFLAGVQRNIRMRMLLEPGSNWKALFSKRSTTTDRLADLYERELYARVKDGLENGPRYLQDLLVRPAGLAEGQAFAPRYDNWRRCHKVPILVLNATALNTCHNWQFTATYMGEPPIRALDTSIDGNSRLRRMYYDEAPPDYRRVRLGAAVAASACVPGLFDPLVFDRLYPGFRTRLVDGGVYDNEGVATLLGEDCTVLLISDASGQTALEKDPGGDRLVVAMRSSNAVMARSRLEQYQLLCTMAGAHSLAGVAYVHLKKDLDPQPVDWIDCPDPSPPVLQTVLTTYGVRKDVQSALAAIRTDLDAFSDAEADALMFSGYSMMRQELAASIHGFPKPAESGADWRFLRIGALVSTLEPLPGHGELMRTLEIGAERLLKPYRVSFPLRVLTWAMAGAVVAGCAYLLAQARETAVTLGGLAAWLAGIVVTAVLLQFLLRRVLRRPNPLWEILLAIPLLVLGWPLIWIWTGLIDPVYLHSGPRYRK